MKTYLNGFFLRSNKHSGVYRFSLNLLKAIDESSNTDSEFILVVPRGTNIPHLNKIKVTVLNGFTNQHLWEQINLAWTVKNNMLINFANFAPIFKHNQLCVIHDAIIFRYPQSYSKKFAFLTKLFHRMIVRQSKYIATVSNFSSLEICQIIGRPKNPILVLGNSALNMDDLKVQHEVLNIHKLESHGYVLAVFSQKNSYYKNVERFLQVVPNLSLPVVCVGSVQFANSPRIENLIQIGNISDQDLKSLYCNARALVIPSLYEGFGIPALEAMQCNCPVIASDIEPLREVCGDAAAYFDPENIINMTDVINSLISDFNKLEELVEKGRKRSTLFSWKNYANEILTRIKVGL